MPDSVIDNRDVNNADVVPTPTPTPVPTPIPTPTPTPTPGALTLKDYERASGYLALAYGTFVVNGDATATVNYLQQALQIVLNKQAVTGVGAGVVDYVQLVGLIARAIEKIALNKDLSGALADILAAVAVFKV